MVVGGMKPLLHKLLLLSKLVHLVLLDLLEVLTGEAHRFQPPFGFVDRLLKCPFSVVNV